MSISGEGPVSRSARTVISFPAARSEGVLVETIGDETVVYDLDTKAAHCLKPLAALVFNHADGGTSAEEIAALAEERLGEPITESQVQEAITQLNASALLDAPLTPTVGNGLSRRQMIGKSAATAGGAFVGASLITTIFAPTAGAAGASDIPTGCLGCRVPPDCASNHCCQGVKECSQGCCVIHDNSCQLCGCDAAGENCKCTVLLAECPPVCPAGSCCTTTPPTNCI